MNSYEILEKDLKELKDKAIPELDVFIYYIMDFIKEENTWSIVEYPFNHNLSPINSENHPVIKYQSPSETDAYMKGLYEFSCKINGYHPKKDIEEVISDTHIRRKIIDYCDRSKALNLYKKKAIH